MKVGSIGYNYEHGHDFVFEKPFGPGAALLLLMKADAILELSGREQRVRADSFVLIDRDTPCSYRADGGGYTDDWLFLDLEDGDRELLGELDIPFNTVFKLRDTGELSKIMKLMTLEHYSADEHRGLAEQAYLRILLIRLSRMIAGRGQADPGTLSKASSALIHLRTRIYNEPDRIGSIDALAQEVSMSRSGLQHAYKRMFSVSLMQDIVSGRITAAKRLLTTTDLKLEDISQRCGYSSVYSFMRQFRDKTGTTAAGYRRSQGSQ